MDNKELVLRVYELKGMVASFMASAEHHDSYNYPMIKNIEKVVNEMVSIVSKKETKSIIAGYYSPKSYIPKSKGFHEII